MKDEIKEILQSLKEHTWLEYEEMDKLLDYITNLQERKITKEDVDKYFEENMCVSFDKFIENWNEKEEWANYFKKENERLKQEIKNLKFILSGHWEEYENGGDDNGNNR